MGRWMMATGLALSVIVNVLVLAKLSESRRDIDELRRRNPGRGVAQALSAPAPEASVPVSSSSAPARTEPAADAPVATPAPRARSPIAVEGIMDDLDRIDRFWKAVAKLAAHHDSLGAEYERAVLDLTASFTGVDPSTLAAAARQYTEDIHSESEDAYDAASRRFSAHFNADINRAHRSLIARVDDWISALEGGAPPLTGASFSVEGDK